MSQRLSQTVGLARFTGLVEPMPGSSDLAISHSVYNMTCERGHGTQANKLRCEEIEALGYSAVVCVVNMNNIAQIRILTNNSWVEGPSFFNKRSKRRCAVWMKEL